MKRKPPTSTVLHHAEGHGLTEISEEQAQEILGIFDTWIDRWETEYKWLTDESNNAPPEHRNLALDLQQAVTLLKEYRSTIWGPGQSWWALGMLTAAHVGTVWGKLGHDLDWFVKHNPLKATRGRQKKAAERHQWLKDQIIEFVRDGRDIEGCLNDRRQLRAAYKSKWVKKDGTFLSDRTFSDDLKALDY